MGLPDPVALLDPYARALVQAALAHVEADRVAPRQRRLWGLLRRLCVGPGSPHCPDVAGLAPFTSLLERCTAHLGDVLTGRLPATEVLFPGGSLGLVEPVYRGNPWSDHFNGLTARAAGRAVAALSARSEGPVRVLEVGAGTGGTTEAVLRALDPHAARVVFEFTDVSAAFVAQAQVRFARPFLQARVLDLERDLLAQGQAPVHVVIATNVLHATTDIGATLGRLHAVMQPGGLLLVNELMRAGIFATATFGLLDGWWAFADAARAGGDSPLLDVQGWTQVLGEQGFGQPGVFGLTTPPGNSFQCLMVAERLGPVAAKAAPAAVIPAPCPSPAAKGSGVADRVAAALAAVLGFTADELPYDRPFAELGVDSIVAPQLVAAINAGLGCGLETTDVFNYATVTDLAARVASLLPAAPGSAPVPVPVLEPARDTDIAVIGLACRFPGAPDAEAFWDLIEAGGCAVRAVPAERWDWRRYHAPTRQPGKLYAYWGAFLEDHDRFDPEFFNLSWREAAAMSPQQRVFLQTAWHALEDAGYPAAALFGLDCGVFVGVTHRDHATQGHQGESLPALGNSMAILPARLSYHLNLRGPSLPIDTACSSSLVAIHMACQSLLSGDCSMALAGGVSVLLTDPELHLFLSDSGMASPTGQCHAFDAAADGFVPGEGAGAVVLKRLSQARADGDRVLGIIRASGVNQDGRSSGITAPCGPAQVALERAVHLRAGIDAATIGYVETHGTGTRLGDPIEVKALAEAFGGLGDGGGSAALGAVKANIGHTLAAAGVAGLIKVLLMGRAGVIPPCAGFKTPNPEIGLERTPFRVPVAAEPWTGLRRAAVSSFGFSGTNAHLVVDVVSEVPGTAMTGRYPVLLSARSEEALARQRAALRRWLDRHAPVLPDLAFTLASGRTGFEHRWAVMVDSLDALRAALDAGAGQVALAGGASARAATAAFATAVGTEARVAAWLQGGAGDWGDTFPGARRVAAPLYPFAMEHFGAAATHPLLGARSGIAWPLHLAADAFPLRDHVYAGKALLPAAAMLDAVLSAALQDGAALPCRIADVTFAAPVYAGSGALLTLDGGAFTVRSGGITHAEGRVGAVAGHEAWIGEGQGDWIEAAAAYARFAAMGFAYGPGLRAIERLRAHGDEVWGWLSVPEAAPVEGFVLHPALLDGAIQAAVALASGAPGLAVPARLGGLSVWGTLPSRCRVHLRRERAGHGVERLHIRLAGPDGRVLVALDGLDIRVEQRAAIGFHVPSWTAVEATPARPDILFDMGEALWEALGRAPILVEPGAAFGQTGPQRFVVRADSAEDHARLLAETQAATIWHAWSRHGGDASGRGVVAVAVLMQALVRTKRAARVVHGHDGSAWGGAVGGLARAVAQEQGLVRLVSVAAAGPGGLEAMERAGGERVGWRTVEPEGAPPLRRGGTYLISGGLGGVGAVVARHLVRAWDARVVVLGRTRRDAVLTGIGPAEQVFFQAADVAEDVQVTAALDAGRVRFGPLHGVFHAAGVQHDGALRDVGMDRVRAVLDAKMRGAVALDRATAGDPLEVFALFSSVAGTFGSPGQAAYSAANAFLDCYARDRRGPGRSVSIGWPFWRIGGMDAGGAEDARALATGIRPLDEAEGCAAFEAALSLGPHVLPLAGDAGLIRRFLDGPLMAEAAEAPLGLLMRVFAQETGTPPGRVNADKPFDQYGVDSLLVMKLNAALERELGPLPSTLFFDHATLRSLAGALETTAAARFATPKPEPSAPKPEGIAIIGIAGRFPDAASLDAFWSNLQAGTDVIRTIPPERWDHARHFDATPGRPGKAYAQWGGFVPDVDRFDPLFFNIAPAEAERMDPQERLFLETCWEAMEDAGHTRASMGRDGAVFVGVMYGDYQLRVLDQHSRGNPVQGAAPYWSIANRVSYVLDLHGPSMAVDTACSSSLSAIHLACQALAAGEVSVAVAGGVNLSLHPSKFIGLSQGRFASTDGRCRSFAAGGDGYVPGEGVGAVILKPLAAALADGDHVHAVIRGWSANHGGKTNGYTVPSPSRQAAAIGAAMRRAGVEPGTIGYVEAHGTGTALGDPIEIAGLAAAYAGAAPGAVRVGSAKASIGHLEAAAGIAGVAKVVLQMRHRRFAPMPGFGGVNPVLGLVGAPLRLQHEAAAWDGPLPLRAGISSFGAGGANAHLVLEEAPARPVAAAVDAPGVAVLSARSRSGLMAYAARLMAALDPAWSFADVLHTLQHGREPMAARLAFVCGSVAALKDRLAAVVAGDLGGVQFGLLDEETAPVAAAAGAGLDALARAWVQGAVIAWPVLGRRMPLPPHPFERRRYWIAEVDAAEVGLSRHFGLDDGLVRDHQVGGRALIPGMAQVMLALSATGADGLAGMVFEAPIVVPSVGTTLRVERDGGRFRVTGDDGTVHAKGSVGHPDTVPLAVPLELQDDAGWPVLTRADVYARLAGMGLHYGPTLALLDEVRVQGDTVTGRLAAGEAAAAMDAGLQALIGLLPAHERRLFVPFALGAVRLYGDPARACSVVGRRRGGEAGAPVFDLALFDAAGVRLLDLTGLATRPLNALPVTIARPVWRLADALGPALADGIVLHRAMTPLAVGTEEHIVWDATAPEGETASCAEALALDLLEGLQALDRAGRLRQGLRLTVLTSGVHSVRDEPVDPRAGALAGVAKVAALEFPLLKVALVDADAAALVEGWVARAAAEPATVPVTSVAWRGAARFVLGLETTSSPDGAAVPQGAVWAIVGGAGGLGLAFAAWLAREHGARVALLGRRPVAAVLDGATLPAGVRYWQGDATDPIALTAAFDGVRAEWGGIDVVIHAALVLRDAPLTTMDAAMFRAALAPKVSGVVALEAALAGHAPGLVVLFSSANAYPGSAGQGNYVAGSCFADAWARGMRGGRGWRVATIGWGLWGQVGAVRGPEFQARLARLGVHPIAPHEGFAAFAAILVTGLPETIAVKAEPGALAQLGVVAADPVLEAARLGPVPGLPAALDGLARIERAGRRRLRDQLVSMGGGLPSAYTPAGLVRRLGIATRHRHLFAALMDSLAADGVAVRRDGLWRFPPLGEVVALPVGTPWLAGSKALLDACLDRYAPLLRGEVDPIEVIFPDADMALAQAAYDGNPVGDAVNAAMASVAAAQAAIVRAAGGVPRLLEVGAGTGASTAAILDRIGAAEYVYTDVSPRFLAHGEARFGSRPGISFRVFDAQRDSDAIAPASFDAVLAANVLHATVSLRDTIGRMRRLLRPGGVLVVNEMTTVQDLSTMVFGLTEGWWVGAAEPGRLPGSPLLDEAAWRAWLLEAGFADVRIDTAGPQSLIVARAPGRVTGQARGPIVPLMLPRSGAIVSGALPDRLRAVFAAVLRVEPEEMRLHEPFDAYGLESLTALDIRNRLEADFPGVSPTLLFEHNTLGRLTAFLEASYPAIVAAMAAPLPEPQPAPEPEPAAGPNPDEPIAIIGHSARLPGGPDFWGLLARGGQAIREVPPGRWDVDAHFDTAGTPGRAYTRWGGFIEGVDRFDPLFFGISPLEAESMDPQERLFLQTAWATLEAAGVTPRRLAAAGPVGVFVGVMNSPYQWLAAEAWRDGHDAAGSSQAWSMANRVSYHLDFAGPSMAVDTACSSSLTAIHLACESLRRGECAVALAGGVNLILHPRQLVNLSAARMLSRGAECRAFATGADGFVDGEGVGAVLLKPLSAALRDGDRIEGVIRGSAVNAGGRTAGYTVPNPQAQGAVVRAALRRAGVAAASIGHIETHGTGTALGDPIEIAGLSAALREGRTEGCTLGALKANIGHLESAAGIAGLVKLLLQLRHGWIAPHPFAAEPNPLIDLGRTPFSLPAEGRAWVGVAGPDNTRWPRRAGLSAFGAGGANAHLVIEEAPPRSRAEPVGGIQFVPLSARDEAGLVAVARRLLAHLEGVPELALADVAHTMRIGRVALPRRAAILAADRSGLCSALAAIAAGTDSAAVIRRGSTQAAAALAETSAGRTMLAGLLATRALERLATLWCEGADIDWTGLASGGRAIALPTYPFAEERYWLPTGAKPAKERPALTVVPLHAPEPPAQVDLLHLLGRGWRAAAAPREGPMARLVVLDDAPGVAWPGPVLRTNADDLGAVLAGQPDPLVVLVQDFALEPLWGVLRTVHAAGRSDVRVLHVHGEDAGGPTPHATGLRGLARSAAAERPGAGMRAVAIVDGLADLAFILRAEGLGTDTATEVLYRGGRRHLPVMTRPEAGPTAPAFRTCGVYLIPGGLGEVGVAVAEQIMRRHRAAIAIIGRRPEVGVVSERLAALRAFGAVEYARADIAAPEEVARAVAGLQDRLGAINGVLHMATAPVDGLIGGKSDAAVQRTLRPKIAGVLALDAALASVRLDWFIACSSAAGWLGLPGGADYAYASAWQSRFMAGRDALVRRGERHGRSLAIAWPQWRYDRHLRADKLRAMERVGIEGLDAAEGLALIGLALRTPGTDLLAVRADAAPLAGIIAAYEAVADAAPEPIGAELAQLDDAALARYVAGLRRKVLPVAEAAPPNPGGDTAGIVIDAVCGFLKVPVNQVTRESRFDAFGLDSIKALHVAELLTRRLGLPVEPALFFEHPTVAALAAAMDGMRMLEAGQ